MKKFGKPIGAGPGGACENVGLAAVGMPSPWRIGLASGRPSALALREASSSPVALRSFLPTVFWPSWPPAETEGALWLAPGTASAVVPGVLSDGVAGEGAVAGVSAAGAGVGDELVSAGAG